MDKPVLLDSGPLGRLAHPRPNPDISLWLLDVLKRNWTVVIPEITDYEVRRGLLHADKKSLCSGLMS